MSVIETARVYFEVGTRIGFDWLRARIEKLTVDGPWQAIARTGLRDAALRVHRRLTERVLARTRPRQRAGTGQRLGRGGRQGPGPLAAHARGHARRRRRATSPRSPWASSRCASSQLTLRKPNSDRTARQADSGAPRPEYLERREPVHRLDRRRPVGARAARRRRRPGASCSREQLAIDIAFTSVLKRAIRTLWIMLDEMDRMWMPVERILAAQRAALRRAAGTEQGADRRAARRGAGEDLAPQLRHPAAAARRPTTSAIRASIRAMRTSTRSELPATESLKDTLARVLPYWHARIAPSCARAQRHGGGARQQPARHGEDAR